MESFLVDGEQFRDLDHDGQLSPFEDWRLPPAARADDLIRRLSIEEQVGLLLHGSLPASDGPLAGLGVGRSYDLEAADTLIRRGVTCMISRLTTSPRQFAAQNNAIQQLAAKTRFGIPVTISTDPRHHVGATLGAGVDATGFSEWPGTLGLAAVGGPGLVRRFGDVVRQEYRATGLHMSLAPQADLATSPRWSRIDGTFGEDPAAVRRLVGAYVEGVQGGRSGLGADSVAAVVKHWVGYGASPEGFDGHNYYCRFSSFPGGAFRDHVEAFLDAFAGNVAGVMPTYNILKGLVLNGVPVEEVGVGYCQELVSGLLRDGHGFAGLVLSDWAILRDANASCRTGTPPMGPQDIGMPWGVEDLDAAERCAKAIRAGVDQFGGEDDPRPILDALARGLIDTGRVAESARRVLLQKFELGLFDDPFVDQDAAETLVGQTAFVDEGRSAQRRSVVVLECGQAAPAPGASLFIDGFPAEAFRRHGFALADDPETATLGVVRLETPAELLHPGHFFGSRQKEGRLDFAADDEQFLKFAAVAAKVPTIAVVAMDRPAILTRVRPLAAGVIATFGVSVDEVAGVIANLDLAEGTLPYALPASMGAVEVQCEDRPGDDPAPLYLAGHPGHGETR